MNNFVEKIINTSSSQQNKTTFEKSFNQSEIVGLYSDFLKLTDFKLSFLNIDDIQIKNILNETKNNINFNEGFESYKKLEIYSEKQAEIFTEMLKRDFIEPGYQSSSELYLKKCLQEKPVETKDWLCRILLNNTNNPSILVKLLHIISGIGYEILYPQGALVAVSATILNDDEVKEAAIRAFEKWGNEDSLKYLKNLDIKEEWLKEYLDEVIAELEEEFISNDISSKEVQSS